MRKSENVTEKNSGALTLERNGIPLRYLRNIGTITVEGQKRLLSSTIAVAGVGGLGGEIADQLARLGCGRIIIIDPDRFSEEDLNRQMCTENDLPEFKVAVVAARIKEINSAVTVTCHANAITQENIHELIKEANVVVDGLDNVPSRLIVEAACRYLRVPFVHGAICGFGGQVMTIFPEDKGLSYIYDRHISLHGRVVEVQIGNLITTIRLVAAWEVQEVINIITGIGEPRHNRLLLLDIREGTVHEIKLN
jgi:molybdopterin/thiamine biosynthesis adenylyltransferase